MWRVGGGWGLLFKCICKLASGPRPSLRFPNIQCRAHSGKSKGVCGRVEGCRWKRPGSLQLVSTPEGGKTARLGIVCAERERTHGVVGGCILHVRSRDVFLSLRALFSTPPTPEVSNRYLFGTSVAVCGRRGRLWLIPRGLYRAPYKDHSQVHFVSPFSISPSKLDRLDCFLFLLPLPRRELRFRYTVYASLEGIHAAK